MRFSVLALLAGAVACSSYSTTNLITPDEDGFAGATMWTSEASEQGGASAAASSNATATTAAQLATGGAAVAVTGGTQAEKSSAIEAGGTTPTSTGHGGSSVSTVLAFGGSSTGGASTVANECSAIYAPCGTERTCTSFSRVPYGTCFYGSFYCGKYLVWYYKDGPVSVCDHTERGCSPGTEFERYYQSNCSAGAGGTSGVGGQPSGGSVTGGTTATTVARADCSTRENYVTCKYCGPIDYDALCKYKNDPSDPMECVAEANPSLTCQASFVAACNHEPGGVECWNACSACNGFGEESTQCRAALMAVPTSVRPCSTTYPEV